MKKILGIAMLAATLLSGVVVFAQNSNSSTTAPSNKNMNSGTGGHRHSRRHGRRGHRRRSTGNANKG
jgi:hypothetical protein